MAKAGDQYAFRTGNIWNFCQRDDVKAVSRLVDSDVDPALRNQVDFVRRAAVRAWLLIPRRGGERHRRPRPIDFRWAFTRRDAWCDKVVSSYAGVVV